MLKLIQCTPNPPKPSKGVFYRRAYERKVEALFELIKIKKVTLEDYVPAIFLGVKSYATSQKDDESKHLKSLMSKHKSMKTLTNAMMLLTPRQFMNIFPITKTYDGAKYEIKDYFYVMDMINKKGIDTPIGDRIIDFLWDYLNRDTNMFLVKLTGLTSDIAQANGQPNRDVRREYRQYPWQPTLKTYHGDQCELYDSFSALIGDEMTAEELTALALVELPKEISDIPDIVATVEELVEIANDYGMLYESSPARSTARPLTLVPSL